jgi:hypothetical protein
MAAEAEVKIESRTDAFHSGTFMVNIDFSDPLRCDPKGGGYPIGDLPMLHIDMSDSMVMGPLHEATGPDKRRFSSLFTSVGRWK